MAAIAVTALGPSRAFQAFAAIGVLMFGGLLFGVPALVSVWSDPDPEGHRIHSLSHGIVAGILLTGAFLVQLRSPQRRIAAMQQAIVVATFLVGPFLAWTLASGSFDPMISVFLVLAIAAVAIPAWLHPARADLFRRGRVSLPLLSLAAIGSLGAAYYAAEQFGLQLTVRDIHSEQFHYGGAASAVLAIATLALLASVRPSGWRVPSWSAGVGAVVFGVGSMLYPDRLSSLGSMGGAVAVLMGLGFIALTERIAGRE